MNPSEIFLNYVQLRQLSAESFEEFSLLLEIMRTVEAKLYGNNT